MENQFIINLVEDFFKKNPPPYFSFDFAQHISERKLNNARKLYAFYDSNEEKPLILLDNTLLSSAKIGALITTENIYYRLYADNKKKDLVISQISLSDIYDFTIRSHTFGADLFINSKYIAYIMGLGKTGYGFKDATALNELLKIFIEHLHPIIEN